MASLGLIINAKGSDIRLRARPNYILDGELVIEYPRSVPVVLAQNLPKASNYFFSYFIIQASSTVTITLLHGNELFNFVLSRILDKTGRQKWTRSESVHLKSWGTFILVYTNLTCIGMSLPQLS